MGLAICRVLCRNHGGSLTLRNGEKGGAAVSLYPFDGNLTFFKYDLLVVNRISRRVPGKQFSVFPAGGNIHIPE